MLYPIAIELGSDTTAYGVVVPDLPGCFSAGDTLEEAFKNAQEAVYAWVEATLDAGGEIPAPSAVEAVLTNPEYAGWTIALLTVDAALLDTTPERVNIILPRRVLHLLDGKAKAHGESRSGYIAQLALAAEPA